MQNIQGWLAELGLEKFAPAFADAEIEYGDLEYLSDDDLKELGLPMGPRRRLIAAIKNITDKIATPKNPGNVAPTRPQTEAAPQTDAERRHLTVMFVDLVGSTEMATKMDAEDMRDVITSYQNTVAGVVSRFEGFVAKFMGDGVLCYFGWPRANEDDAERAVRAGLSIIDAVKITKAPNGSPLSTRVGIATGVVIVGDLIGSGATQEAAVVGETPNLAARLQGVAGLNQLVVAKETQRLLGAIFELTRLDGQDLKGISGPVDAYRVEAEATVQSRFAARQSGALTPIIGREREIDLMSERWALARSGHGQMVIVSGEAGIGKSRITQAVIDDVANDDHIRITYQCSPYHADSAFYPVTQQMSFAVGFAPSDNPDVRLDKLEALLGDDQDTLRLIAPLMGLDGEARYGALDLTPAQQRARTMQALAELLVRQAAEKPVLMVFEDLHWIDPTSLELLDILLDAITDQPIMILATARPTFEYGFGGHPIVTKFALNRLGKDQIGSIVAKLTDGKALPDEIMEIIAQRTDGVPLFVEELTKTILESGALKDDGERYVLNGPLSAIPIPTTLHDSLMARLDRLNPIKEVAQTAACIGREFSHGLLAQISPLPDAELSEAMDGLIAAELIYRRGLPPEATYLFKHALVRDAAYESQLKEKRRAVHTRILSALETDADIAPEVLANHAEAANLTDCAIELWEAAGKAAIARPAFKEGISNLRRATSLLSPLIADGDAALAEQALQLQVQLGVACMQGTGYASDETKEALEHALVLADKVGETPLRAVALYALWTGMNVRAEHAAAHTRAQEVLGLAEKTGNTELVGVGNRLVGINRLATGRIEEADHCFNQAVALLDPIENKDSASRIGLDAATGTLVYVSWIAAVRARTRQSDHHAREAEKAALDSNHIPSICYMHAHLMFVALTCGDETALERHTIALKPIAEEHNLELWEGAANVFDAILGAKKGDASAIDRYYQIDAKLTSIDFRLYMPLFRISAGRRAMALGLKDHAQRLAAMAEELIQATGETFALSDLHRLQAAIAIADDDTEAAEQYLVTALDVTRRQSGKLWELRAAIDLAGLWRDQGKTAEAISLLQPVHDSIAEGDCSEDRAVARELLAALAE